MAWRCGMNQGAKIIHEMGEIVLELARGGKFYIVFLQRGEMLGGVGRVRGHPAG